MSRLPVVLSDPAYRLYRCLTSLPIAEITLAELQEELHLSKTAILRAIKELEAAGLVAEQPDEE